MDNPSIYAADLAAYNNGILHGAWIDATRDLEDMQKALQEMLKASPMGQRAEEWAIHDYASFHSLRISEHQGLEHVRELALFVEEHGRLGTGVLENFGYDVEQAKEALEESYAGQYVYLSDFAEQLTEDTTEVPEALQYYIDYEAMGRDMELGGDIFTVKTEHLVVHVFWNR